VPFYATGEPRTTIRGLGKLTVMNVTANETKIWVAFFYILGIAALAYWVLFKYWGHSQKVILEQ